MTRMMYVIVALFAIQLVTSVVHNDTAFGIVVPERPTKNITRPSKGLSEKTHRVLQRVHVLIEQKNYQAAIEKLQTLKDRTSKKPHELAQVLQTMGYVQAHKEDYAAAAKSFENALALDALPKSPTLTSLYTLAQLQVMSQDYRGALATLQEWFYLAESPGADALVLAATCYVELKDYKAAIPLAKQAIAKAEKPKESWYQMLLSVQFFLKDYANAAATLKTMIGFWPKEPKYYKQLSAVYLTTDDYVNALAIGEIAYKQGFASEEKDLLNLANLFLLNGIPYRAAELVEKEINLGRIKKTKKTYELMAGSWHSARELDKAIMAYNVAAEIGKDPKIFVQVGRIHAEQEQWDEAIAAYEKALKLGNFKNTGEVQLAVGIAKFYSQDKTGAIASLKNALAQADTKSQAAKWLDFVNRH